MKKIIEKSNEKIIIISLSFILILLFIKNICCAQQDWLLNFNLVPDMYIIAGGFYPSGINFIGGDEPWENRFGYGQNFIGGDEPWENRFGQMGMWSGGFYTGYEMSNWDTIHYTSNWNIMLSNRHGTAMNTINSMR